MNNEKDINTKIVASGYRILKSLLLLLEKPKSIKELQEALKLKNPVEQNFTDETILKIIHTLKSCNIKIDSHKRKYKITKLPWNIDLSESSIETLFNLKNFAQTLQHKEIYQDYTDFLQKILPFLKETYYIAPSEPEIISYKKVEKLMNNLSFAKENNYKIKVETNDNSFIYDSFTLHFHKNTTYIKGYINSNHSHHTISIKEIKSIKCLPQKSSGLCMPMNILLEISGPLKNAYSIKPNETLVDFDEEKLIISNKGEDRKTLLKRILKYQKNCKISTPHALKAEYVKMLKDILTKYKEM